MYAYQRQIMKVCGHRSVNSEKKKLSMHAKKISDNDAPMCYHTARRRRGMQKGDRSGRNIHSTFINTVLKTEGSLDRRNLPSSRGSDR